MSNTLTIANATLGWEYEDSFRTLTSTPTFKAFGRNESLGTIEYGQEQEELNDWGSRDVDDFQIVGVNPSFSVDCVPGNFWWLEFAVSEFQDSDPVDNGDGSYTWSTDNNEDPSTFQTNVVNTLSGETYKIVGCRIDEAELSTSAGTGSSGDPVNLSLSIDGAAIIKASETTPSTDPAPMERALSFDNVIADFGGRNFVLTDITMTIGNSEQRVKQIRTGDGQGGITDATFFWGGRELTIDHVEFRQADADSELERLLDTNGEPKSVVDAADRPDLALTISNNVGDGASASGGDLNKAVFTLNDLFPEGPSYSGWDDKDSAIEEEITDRPVDASVEWTNGYNSRP